METDRFTEQQSLAVIAGMIAATRRKLERGEGKPFLVWGYTTFITAIAVWGGYTLTADSRWGFLWLAIPPVGYLLTRLIAPTGPKTVTTYTDRVIQSVWIVLGGCCVLTALIASLRVPGVPPLPILFTEALLFETGVAITGLVIRIRYVAVLGFIGLLAAFPLLFIPGIDQILFFSVIPLMGMILPGHIMNFQARRMQSAAENPHTTINQQAHV